MTDIVWKGPEELRAFLVPIGSVHTHEDNPRRGDVPLAIRSLERFGQLKPFVLDRDDATLIVAGNHRYLAALELGWTHVAALEMWQAADSGMRYLLMDNKTSDGSTYDREELLGLLDEYDGDDLAATGFTPDERDQLRDELEADRRAAAEYAAGLRSPVPARRDTAPLEQPTVRNLRVAVDDPAQWEQFTMKLKVLQREWGIPGNSEAIAEAANREALRFQEGE